MNRFFQKAGSRSLSPPNREMLGSLRCYADKNGKVWFVAADVAKGLGFRESFCLSRLLDEDEKGTHSVCTHGGDQQMNVMTEGGFYHAAFVSRVEKARKFRQWVQRG